MYRIAVDAMGGDLGPAVVVDAAIEFLRANPSVHLCLYGDEAMLYSLIGDRNIPSLSLEHAPVFIPQNASPIEVLKRKLRRGRGSEIFVGPSSMELALDALNHNAADACVSAGNTGALMALSRSMVGCVPLIERPAIAKELAFGKARCVMLDLGGTVDPRPPHLVQFASMGTELAKIAGGVSEPRVGLINVGHEDNKGNRLVRDTAELLKDERFLNYQGFVESSQLFENKVDVAVCDGFTGNVALKMAEGVLQQTMHTFKARFGRGFFKQMFARLGGVPFSRLQSDLNPESRNGAVFLGLKKVVVKSHGNASAEAFKTALQQALVALKQDLPRKIEESIALAPTSLKQA